jgi:hypothetical protein
MLGDGNTAISTAQETMILFWLDWKSLLGPPARGHFFGGCMFATDISLKYGTHQPETILETMPIEEASEIIKEKLRDEVPRNSSASMAIAFMRLKKRHQTGKAELMTMKAMRLAWLRP